MNVVDSSAWLEYFSGTPRAKTFAAAIEDTRQLVVPVITVAEVFKRILQQRDETSALRAVAVMQQGEVVAIDAALALSAARLGLQHKLPLADSLIYATALLYDATLWTQDAHFEDLPRTRYFAKTQA